MKFQSTTTALLEGGEFRLTFHDIAREGRLVFEMGPEPNREWGR